MDKGEIIIYQTSDGTTSLDVKFEQETIWVNRQQMAELFGIPVVANFATTALDNKTYQVEHYNIEMVTSVGGPDLYPSIEEKASMLLYLVTKNHSFYGAEWHFV